jgi:hypothetical protein
VTPALGQLGEARHEVEVAILGPVEVRGITVGFARSSALELVVYLAMRPAGALKRRLGHVPGM